MVEISSHLDIFPPISQPCLRAPLSHIVGAESHELHVVIFVYTVNQCSRHLGNKRQNICVIIPLGNVGATMS